MQNKLDKQSIKYNYVKGKKIIEEIDMTIDLTFDGNIAAMKIDGILNSENAHILQEKLTEVMQSNASMLELDLLDCRNISSTGIGKILLFYKDFISKGGEIEVVRSSNSVYDLFSMLKLNQLFTVNLG
ncbi:MAG: STAS domain-containing protein [Candidatus Cloacimonadaceae bacterium]|jgi:anti-sigma B factor antagonist|nr:STAS domain-containing protein [Candidatus Cloacimonadota bacterium]MCB5263391.1 STAS domain-containing protein [Candidatus Cloacimonadota bacterium]MCK9433636.1 STAS domain-containing protein [Candidatus Cloacimonadota bacterium]MDD5535657.1 STAS domain-containing protein [Candidatus Cloacimonadota bacterium]